MSFADLLKNFLSDHIWLAAGASFFLFVYHIFMKTLATQSGFSRLAELARPDRTWIEKYRQLLALGLDRLESFLSPNCSPSNNLWSKFDAESSEKLFVLALVYPILSTVYNYIEFDAGAFLGNVFFFPGTTNVLKKLIVLIVYILSPILSIMIILDYRRKHSIPEMNILTAVNMVMLFVAAMMIIYPFQDPYDLTEAIIGSICISFLYIGALVYIGTGRCSELVMVAAI